MIYTPDECIAALERSARIRETGVPAPSYADAAILRALAEAMRKAVRGKFLNEAGQITPGWHIPEPKVKP